MGNYLYVMNRDGSGLVNLTKNPDNYSWPCWSPNGTHIAFTTETDDEWGVYSIDVNGMNKQHLFDGLLGCKTWFTTAIQTSMQYSSWGQIKQIKVTREDLKP
jgi:Tol biopolymer transport system component